jgi:alkylated DNA repair dioxygenase AlkB
MSESSNLFGDDFPPGFHYVAQFITAEEEIELLNSIAALEFAAFTMRGVVARRRVAFFGESYEGAPAEPLPPFLLPLREKLARWASVDPGAFAMALVNEYRPGTPIGWHRDAPQYDIVAGVSLLSACRMKFRKYLPPSSVVQGRRRSATHQLELARRSGYLMTQEARSAYEHHIPAVADLRYSVTLRTLR